MVCSKQLYKEALNHAFDEPKQWEIREKMCIRDSFVAGVIELLGKKFAFGIAIIQMSFVVCIGSVSYTHLDVYKRQTPTMAQRKPISHLSMTSLP